MIEETNRPRPYKVDNPIHKVQTLDEDGDQKYIFRHDFARLDSSNVDLYVKREKDTVRVTEKIGKGRTRPRYHTDDADKEFYRALITGGGYRPYGLDPQRDEGLIAPSAREFYSFNDDTQLWEPGWKELGKDFFYQLTPEKMGEAIDAWFLCRGRKISQGTLDFMLEKGGIIPIEFLIGDPDQPAYKLRFDIRRPANKKRTQFREDFAYPVDNSKGDVGKVEMNIDVAQGIRFFDEYFATCPDDPKFGEILFTDYREIGEGENQREPRAISAVPSLDKEESLGADLPVRPYSEELRSDMLQYLLPPYKVEMAAAVVQAFSKTSQE
jgi:hypothetical protein